MPRQAGVIVPGFPHYIVQRRHNRQPVFVERRDFEYYLANLLKNRSVPVFPSHFSLQGRRKVQVRWQLYSLDHKIEKLANYGRLGRLKYEAFYGLVGRDKNEIQTRIDQTSRPFQR